VRNEVLQIVKDERNTLCRREAYWIGHFLNGKCLLKHIIEVKAERKKEMT
jgi:hypothetical protein